MLSIYQISAIAFAVIFRYNSYKEEINMLKEVLNVAKVAKKSSLFLGGVAFGTLGLKVLASKEAKLSLIHI